MTAKAELRARALERRRAYARALPGAARDVLERRLRDVLLPRLAGTRVVAGYHPFRDEISPLPALRALGGRRVALPWFAAREAALLFREWPAVERGPWGMQPSAAAAVLRPDAMLVPLVLADRRGARIGHGQGHYDRALAQLKEHAPLLIGVGWDCQLSEAPLPTDPWDVPLHAVATPAGWVDCR